MCLNRIAYKDVNLTTKHVTINANEWVNELANVYADMEIKDVNISRDRISFKAAISGMNDTQADDIRMKIEEYLATNEAFEPKNISIYDAGNYWSDITLTRTQWYLVSIETKTDVTHIMNNYKGVSPY